MISKESTDVALKPLDEFEELLVEWLSQHPYAVTTLADAQRQAELARLRAAKEAAWRKRATIPDQQSPET